MRKTSSNKITLLGYISPDGKPHQSRAVYDRGGYIANRICSAVQGTAESGAQMDKKIKVIGDLGVGGERGRIMAGDGLETAITATEYKDPQKVIRKWKRNA